MKNLVLPLLGLSVLSNCGLELVGATVTAPIWLPIEYATAQSKVVQPVNVVSSSGKQVGPMFGGAEEATFTITRTTVSCTGWADFQINWSDPVNKTLALSCGRNLEGKLTVEIVTTRMTEVSIGPITLRDPVSGEKSQVTVMCKGNFNVAKKRIDPFLLTCPRNSYAVVLPGKVVNGQQKFELFYTPPV